MVLPLSIERVQPVPAKSGIDEPPAALGEHTAMTERRRVLRA